VIYEQTKPTKPEEKEWGYLIINNMVTNYNEQSQSI
jgi:hypothetical protein